MTNNMPILLLFSLSSFFFLVHLVSPLSDTCPYNLCGLGEPMIQFPFHLKQYQPDERCVYPGFELACDAQNRTTLHIPTSGEFIVDSINYIDQVLWLRDPDDCLPKRLQNFNPSGSNWTVQRYRSFTLFKCPKARGFYSPPFQVACLEGDEYYVVAVAADELSQFMNLFSELQCGDNWTIQIPTVNGTYLSPYLANEFTFGLTWAVPSCGSCEARGVTCRFKGKKGLETKCTVPKDDATPKSNGWWIFLVVGIPCITLIVRLLCYISCKYCTRRQVQQNQTDPSSPSGRVQAPVAMSGMDTPAIELYPKTRIGDGGVSMPLDNTCSICLSEYRLQEMVRTIPECKHSFHAHCIDPWLKRNASCPLCRNHPRSTESTA